jgi:hypothetical protein
LARSRGDDDLIAAIYDAIIEPSGWDGVVRRIVEATKSDSGGLFTQLADAVHLSAVHNVDPSYADAYVQTWHEHNPLLTIVATTAPGDLSTCTHIT